MRATYAARFLRPGLGRLRHRAAFGAGRCATRGTGFLVLPAVLAVRASGEISAAEGAAFFFGRSAKRTAGRAGCAPCSAASPADARDATATPPGARRRTVLCHGP